MGTHMKTEREENATERRKIFYVYGLQSKLPEIPTAPPNHQGLRLLLSALLSMLLPISRLSPGPKWLQELQASHPHFRKEEEGKSKNNVLPG